MTSILDTYDEVWLVDFEFSAPPGERQTPVCMVAREYRSGRTIRLWQDELLASREAPFPVGPDALFVAYYASAELGCFLALGWPMPSRILDLCAEFKCMTSGLDVTCGKSLLGAMAYHGLDCIEATEKESMRELAMRGGPWSAGERKALLEYCETDVVALSQLLPKMLPTLDLGRALLRGRYMAAAAWMEWNGIPVDVDTLEVIRDNWKAIHHRLIARIDSDYGVFESLTFKRDRWEDWVTREGIPWPRLPSGELDLKDDTFRDMARVHPKVAPMRELREELSQLRLSKLAVGSDGRNRALLGAFGAKTSRNQPSNSKFVFGPAVWLRGLIRPKPGWAIAYLDWEQQEFGIAAALSGDKAMMEAYQSGDPYLTFAKQAGAVPPDGTKKTHGPVREQYKAACLAVLYGMGAKSLAQRIGQPESHAAELLRLHRATYPTFWKWSDAAVDHAMLTGHLYTVFGWEVHADANANARSLMNFPMQANGAEMLRLACCIATERGIRVCAPVHDALLIEAPLEQIDEVVAETQRIMAEASSIVLGGFPLRSEAKVVRYPDRYMDARGKRMWDEVMGIIAELNVSRPVPSPCCTGATLPVSEHDTCPI